MLINVQKLCGHTDDKMTSKLKGFSKLLEGIVKYTLCDRPHTLFQLRNKGENPNPLSLMFSCMDSRVISSKYTESEVGDNYIIKNAGNFVPFPDNLEIIANTTSAAGALELTCVRNNVRHVIVSGHSDCKAMGILFDLRHEINDHSTRGTPLELWIKKHGSRTIHKFNSLTEDNDFKGPVSYHEEPGSKPFEVIIDPEGKYKMVDKLSQVNCVQQLENIAAYPFLHDRLSRGDLMLHSLWFDMYTAKVFLLSRIQKRFVEVNEDSYFDLIKEVKSLVQE